MSKNSQTGNINSIDGVAIGRTVIVNRSDEQATEEQGFNYFSLGETEDAPRRQAPGQTEALPRRQTPAQTEALPRRQTPGQTEALPRRQTPGQTEALPRRQTPGQTEALPRRQTPAQTDIIPPRQTPEQTEKLPRNADPGGTVRVPRIEEEPINEQPGKTLVLPNNENKEYCPVPKEERDPRPVGFLVVISGPMLGQYFTLSKGINSVGRKPSNHVHLKDDDYISREHAWITYNTEYRSFTIEKATKTSKSTVLSDGREVTVSPMPLESGEILTFSHLTKLRFIPFSNQFFDWDFS